MSIDEYKAELAKPKAMTASEKTARLFLQQVRARRLPEPRSKFHPDKELRFAADDATIPRQGSRRRVLKRKASPRAPQWRFDFSWPELLVAVEVEGLVVMRGEDGHTQVKGRHANISGFKDDCEKYAWAAVLGWRVIRFEQSQVRSGFAIDMLVRLLAAIPVSLLGNQWTDAELASIAARKVFGMPKHDEMLTPPRITDELNFGNAHDKDPF